VSRRVLRVGIQQRALPAYRAAFFDALADEFQGELSVFAGLALPKEGIGEPAALKHAFFTRARNIHLLSGKYLLVWQANLMQWLRDWQPDVLVTEINLRNLRLGSASRWMHRRKRRVVGWGLGAPPFRGVLGKWQGAWRRAFLRQFDALVTYSQQGADEYKANGFPAEKIFVAPNAATPRPENKWIEKPASSLNEGPLCLFVGRLQPRKRVDLLIRACASLQATGPLRLWIVGDGPARQDLETLAKNVFPKAVFWGEKRGIELDSIFRDADLFVLPGTGGLALQQAMSFGLPVISAEADGTQADLVRPENGWTVLPGSLADLTETLTSAFGDAARLRAMGAESYRIVREEINLENMVAGFVKAIRFVSQEQP